MLPWFIPSPVASQKDLINLLEGGRGRQSRDGEQAGASQVADSVTHGSSAASLSRDRCQLSGQRRGMLAVWRWQMIGRGNDGLKNVPAGDRVPASTRLENAGRQGVIKGLDFPRVPRSGVRGLSFITNSAKNY